MTILNTRRAHFETIGGKQLWREAHGNVCTCPSCLEWDGSVGTDPQLAEAWKYSSERIVAMQCLPSGNVVLYDFNRRPFYIGDWFGLRQAYEARPKYTARSAEAEPSIAGIDLSSLDITL